MKLKNFLLISACLTGGPAISDVIKVSIVFGTYEFPIPGGDVKLFRNGKELTSIERTKLEDSSFEFSLEACENDMVFKVTLEGFFIVEREFYPCTEPEVKIAAIMPNFQTASISDPQFPAEGIGNLTVNYSSVTYASWIGDIIGIDPDTLAAMGSTAIENHANMIAALSLYNFGEAAFYANENAALARRFDQTSTAIGYAALTYDAGFRAMGVDPGGATAPLVALDRTQNNIPVPTPEGLKILEAYNTQIVGAPNVNTWGFATSSSLRATSRPMNDPLIQLESFDQFPNLILDVPSGMFLAR